MRTTVTLTPKEQICLNDILEMENLCLAKYSVYASECQDTTLKTMFFNIGRTKQQHAKIINRLLGGTKSNSYQ